MRDSVTPASILDRTDRACLYFNGRFAADPAKWDGQWPRTYWIDVLATAPEKCSILDIEAFDARPADVLQWVPARLKAHPGALCRLYMSRSAWPQVKSLVSQLTPEHRAHVRYWVADWTMHRHLVPGSDATQWGNFADCDISEVASSWDA